MKRTAAVCLCAFGLVLAGSTAAQAGEYNGKGGVVPGGVKGKSACSYSGKDVPDAVENNPEGFDDDALTSQKNFTQNYGLFVSLGLKGVVPSPGVACRGNA
jgi:hypothetical protein